MRSGGPSVKHKNVDVFHGDDLSSPLKLCSNLFNRISDWGFMIYFLGIILVFLQQQGYGYENTEIRWER